MEPGAVGKRTRVESAPMMPQAATPQVQRKAEGVARVDPSAPGSIARTGVEGPAGKLPHHEQIQALFGRHDLSGVKSHEGEPARSASQALGARAFTYGDSVAFSSPPDLHTAAHEAAHVVQQRHGVQLADGIDQPGDVHELHADAVAETVVAGKPAAPLLDQLSRGGPQGTAVQRAPAVPGSAATSDITPPKPGIDKPGFIDNKDGANIRTGPLESGGKALRDKPLAPATRVFVSGTHPDTSAWWYVTAFLPDVVVRGYVQDTRITIELPEPLAELHCVARGETAELLAKKKFGSALTDGHDLRYYENVLLHVNQQQNRPGVTGIYQDPSVFGSGSSGWERIGQQGTEFSELKKFADRAFE